MKPVCFSTWVGKDDAGKVRSKYSLTLRTWNDCHSTARCSTCTFGLAISLLESWLGFGPKRIILLM